MYRNGKTIAEIAEERKLSLSTIESHLSYYIGKQELQLADFVDYKKQRAIQKAVEMLGTGSMRVLKDHLPEDIEYGDIRMVLAARINDVS
jgi:ATP-dependent DNA helicase RecQ